MVLSQRVKKKVKIYNFIFMRFGVLNFQQPKKGDKQLLCFDLKNENFEKKNM